MLETVAAVWLGGAVMATGSLQGKAALYRAQRRGRAVVSSVQSREGRAGTKRPRRGRFRRGLVLSVLCFQGRLNVSNARLMWKDRAGVEGRPVLDCCLPRPAEGICQRLRRRKAPQYGAQSQGIMRFMNSSKSGTVNAVSPWLGLQIIPFVIRPFRVGATD